MGRTYASDGCFMAIPDRPGRRGRSPDLRIQSGRASSAATSAAGSGMATKPGVARTRASQPRIAGYAERSKPPSSATLVYANRESGRAHDGTPDTNAPLACHLILDKNKIKQNTT